MHTNQRTGEGESEVSDTGLKVDGTGSDVRVNIVACCFDTSLHGNWGVACCYGAAKRSMGKTISISFAVWRFEYRLSCMHCNITAVFM